MPGLEIPVTGNIEFKTQNAENQLKGLENHLANLSGSNAGLTGGIASDNAKSNLNDINSTVSALNDAMKSVIANFKVFSEQMKNAGTSGIPGSNGFGDVSGKNSIFKNLNGNYLSKAISSVGLAATYYDANNQAEKQLLTGDYLGAGVTRTRAIASGLSGIGSTMMGLSLIPGVGPVLGITGAAFSLGGMATNAIASYKDKEKTAAEIYSDSLGIKDNLLVGFGNRDQLSSNNYKINQFTSDEMYRNIVARNSNINMSDSDFAQLVYSMRKNGITDQNTASEYVLRAGNIARSTNADASTIANIMGTLTRYGGNGLESMNYAFNNSRRAGFDDTQFDELLQGIQNAMEDGISKGFVVSSKDLIDSVTMLTATSNNSTFWTGKEGMNRVQTMRSGMAGAVGLNTVNDSLLWQSVMNTVSDEEMKAALGDSYISGNKVSNVKAYLEQGNVSDTFVQEYVKRLNGMYGNNADAITSALMSLGFTQNEANQFYNQMGAIGSYTKPEDAAEREAGIKSGSTEVQNAKNILNRKSTTDSDNLLTLVKGIKDNVYDVNIVSEKQGINYDTGTGITFDRSRLKFEAYENGKNFTSEETEAWALEEQLYRGDKVSPDEYKQYMNEVAGTVIGYNNTDGLVFNLNELQDVILKWTDTIQKYYPDPGERMTLYQEEQ